MLEYFAKIIARQRASEELSALIGRIVAEEHLFKANALQLQFKALIAQNANNIQFLESQKTDLVQNGDKIKLLARNNNLLECALIVGSDKTRNILEAYNTLMPKNAFIENISLYMQQIDQHELQLITAIVDSIPSKSTDETPASLDQAIANIQQENSALQEILASMQQQVLPVYRRLFAMTRAAEVAVKQFTSTESLQQIKTALQDCLDQANDLDPLFEGLITKLDTSQNMRNLAC